jgi:hypothetical protein
LVWQVTLKNFLAFFSVVAISQIYPPCFHGAKVGFYLQHTKHFAYKFNLQTKKKNGGEKPRR